MNNLEQEIKDFETHLKNIKLAAASYVGDLASHLNMQQSIAAIENKLRAIFAPPPSPAPAVSEAPTDSIENNSNKA